MNAPARCSRCGRELVPRPGKPATCPDEGCRLGRPTCPICGRRMAPIDPSWSSFRCTAPLWACLNAGPSHGRVARDASKIRAGLELIGALDDLRKVASVAVSELAGDPGAGDPRVLVERLERGIERVVHASAPVQDAIAAWRRDPSSAPRDPSSAPRDPSSGDPTRTPASAPAIRLTRCGRCGVYTASPCPDPECPFTEGR